MAEIKEGDVVVLKSEILLTYNDIFMTVDYINENFAHCKWFHPINRDLKTADFRLTSLEIYDENE